MMQQHHGKWLFSLSHVCNCLTKVFLLFHSVRVKHNASDGGNNVTRTEETNLQSIITLRCKDNPIIISCLREEQHSLDKFSKINNNICNWRIENLAKPFYFCKIR